MSLVLSTDSVADDVYDFSQECLDQLTATTAQALGSAYDPPMVITSDPRKAASGMSGIDGKLHWLKGWHNGIKDGKVSIDIYPIGIVNDSGGKLSSATLVDCSPFTIGYTLGVTVHEYLHKACGAHPLIGADCAGLAIGLSMVQELCEGAGKIKECLEGPCDPDGIPEFPGIPKGSLPDTLSGLCSRIDDARMRHNGASGSAQASQCAGQSMPPGCLPDGLMDVLPSPPDGWEAPEGDEIGDWPIPSCPACQESGGGAGG